MLLHSTIRSEGIEEVILSEVYLDILIEKITIYLTGIRKF